MLQLSTLAVCTTEDTVSIFILTLIVLQVHMLPTNNKQDLRINIKCTLTDRVAVNHCVVQSLPQSTLEKELLKLKCNGIAKQCMN